METTVTEQFSLYDPADHLKDAADIVAYLMAAAEDGEASTMAAALGAVARANNMSRLARTTGLTREGLSKALSEAGNPRLDTVMKVAAALGLRMTFVPR
jgi:probable addiction module antidote protein